MHGRFCSTLNGAALAQSVRPADRYPQKPVRIMVGLNPGSNPDLFARMMAHKLAQTFDQQFRVEKRPCSGNSIAANSKKRESISSCFPGSVANLKNVQEAKSILPFPGICPPANGTAANTSPRRHDKSMSYQTNIGYNMRPFQPSYVANRAVIW